ncbi:MAG: LysM peptidoglycan-binding domain-containing protein [Treponema sp.]|nr:LysM peptidoglycan-binding domain-containing protein [Treponema sp.]
MVTEAVEPVESPAETGEPVEAAPPAVQPAAIAEQTPLLPSYTVQTGDTLWGISANPRIYNNPYLWPRLYIINRERFREPDNPDLILPGQILQIPEAGDSRFYAVQEGDSLTSIATDLYNDPYQWTRLFNSNRNRMIDPENPHLIFPGMILEIPRP